jgi:tetratricopeptide (TPR) repeat protein
MRILSVALLCALAGAALAAPQPAGKPLDQLFKALKQAPTPDDAKPIETQIGYLFLQSGSPSVDLLMTRGNALAGAGDKDNAKKIFIAVTDIAPSYAEGWHARAEMEIDGNDDEGAMVSLGRVVALNPRQFKAMVELAGLLEDYNDKAGALKLYRRALALDPQLDGVDHHIKALSTDVEGQGI